MNTHHLDSTTTARLHALARLTGRPESDLLREAVTAYLEDLEDIRATEESLREIESGAKPPTLAELDEYLDRDLAR
ncbi:type II toxin-antitoxin system RelB family antitoxin [Thiocapsa marina]|uniref:Ribbon-helix-helix protein CopG domain-containing protein n=1 Tax=Thiocapsa marina 5811 TaxID=768671 RepID=F9UCZ8_9GAMM|nr:ribbon-helix-helix protein, CopG family [Thiocapsa marina]EGV17742.1 hypothetical protein ThimaDRAFT_2800 [Thiocapsa marina 5811]